MPDTCFEQFIEYLPQEEREYSERPKRMPYGNRPIAKISYDRSKLAADTALEKWFAKHAERWQRETAIHSSPLATYIHRDYIQIIAKGIENPKEIVPLIFNHLSAQGGDWFFALEKITNENPARDSVDYETAIAAWNDWFIKNLK